MINFKTDFLRIIIIIIIINIIPNKTMLFKVRKSRDKKWQQPQIISLEFICNKWNLCRQRTEIHTDLFFGFHTLRGTNVRK